MRVLILATTSQTIQAFFEFQVSALRAAGVTVYVGSNMRPSDSFSFIETNCQISIPFSRGMNIIADLRALVTTFQAVRAIRPDIVHCYTPKAGLLGMIAAKACGVKIRVYTLLGFPAETARHLRKSILTATETLTCRLATRIYAASPSLRAVAVRCNIASATEVRLIEGSCFGVNTERLHPEFVGSTARTLWRRHLGLSPEHVVVGFIGRLAKDKGLDILASSWPSVCSRCPEARLLIHGAPETREPIGEALTNKLRHLPNAMLSEAFIGDIRELYSIFDLFVLPSRREGLPTVLLEASSMCVPSVTTRATGCVDVVQDFYNGVIVDLDDPSQLSDAIVTLINNAPLRKRLGVAARATAVEKFDSQRACRALIEEYNALVGDNGNNTRPSGASGALAV